MRKILLFISLFIFSAEASVAQNSTQNKSDTNKIDSPVKIFYKPRAVYPQSETGTFCFTGVVRLRIEFLESGKIGQIFVVSSLPYGADENAIAAARKIKFTPAKRDGRKVRVYKTIEFSFNNLY